MKTREFVEEIKKMGFAVIEEDNWVIAKTSCDGYTLAIVVKKEMYIVDTSFYRATKLNGVEREKLFDLFTEYARTPLGEREDEQRFVIRSKFTQHYAKAFNYLWEDEGKLYLAGLPVWENAKTSFTKKEIEAIKEKYQVSLDDFELIEEERQEEEQ